MKSSLRQRLLSTEFAIQAFAIACMWKAVTVPHADSQPWLAAAIGLITAGRVAPTEKVDEALSVDLKLPGSANKTEGEP